MAKFDKWDKPRDNLRAAPDFQCAYATAGGIRCREIGAISDSTTGGGPWYCREHYSEKRTRFADDVVEFSHRYDPVKQRPRDWRDELRAKRQQDLQIADKISRDEAIAILAQTTLGQILLKNLGRELKPRNNPEE